MNWQTELNSSLSWILTALFWVIVCFSVTTLALKQTTFGQKFWHIASPSINRRNSIKIIVMLLVLFTMILLEVRFSVLNSFFYNGLYSSMQELDADKFWFSLFHELAHIIYGHIAQVEGTTEDDEADADAYARDTLIPNEKFDLLIEKNDFSKDTIKRFAAYVGIDVGIVVGRLQREGFIEYSWYNDLKTKYILSI